MTNKFPQLYIVGAMKAATTSLANALDRHGVAKFPHIKEPNYFICSRERFPFTGPGASPAGFVDFSMTEAKYLALYENFDGSTTGDASTNYLVSEYSPPLVKQHRPDAKIVIVLRKPTSRAYSAFNFVSGGAGDPSANFREAIASELRGERDTWLPGWRYLHYGLYALHVSRWTAEFGPQNVLLLDFESLLQDPTTALNAVADLVGNPRPEGKLSILSDNTTTVPKSKLNAGMRKILLADTFAKRLLKPLLPSRYRQVTKRHLLESLRRSGTRPDRMEAETESQLYRYYLESIMGLRDYVEEFWPNRSDLVQSIGDWIEPTDRIAK